MERDNDGATPLHFAAARGRIIPIRYSMFAKEHYKL